MLQEREAERAVRAVVDEQGTERMSRPSRNWMFWPIKRHLVTMTESQDVP